MITVALSTTIGASSDRVWRALTDPSERIVWDERILGEVSLSRGTHQTTELDRKKTKWRFRLGGVPVIMQDTISEADRYELLVSRISIGSMHFEQTLRLHREDDDNGPRTRLSMKIVVQNQIAVIGELVQRLDVQKVVIEFVDTTLRQVQKHCESDA